MTATLRQDKGHVVFLTRHEAMSTDSARFFFKLANNMHAVGYSTATVNLGPGMPRPDWLVPAYLQVGSPAQLHTALERLSPGAIISTSWHGAFLAFDEARRSGRRAYFFNNDLEMTSVDSIADAMLFMGSLRLGEVLTLVPGIFDSLVAMGVREARLLRPPVDDALLQVHRDELPRDVVFFSNVRNPKQDDLVVEAFLQSKVRADSTATLRSIGYREGARRGVDILRHDYIPWQNENSQRKAYELSNAMCLVSAGSQDDVCFGIVEAMATGCPVVALRSRGTEGLCLDEENCLLVSSPEAAAIAAAIDRISSDAALRQRLTAGGLRTTDGDNWGAVLESLPDGLKMLRDPERAPGLGMPRWNV